MTRKKTLSLVSYLPAVLVFALTLLLGRPGVIGGNAFGHFLIFFLLAAPMAGFLTCCSLAKRQAVGYGLGPAVVTVLPALAHILVYSSLNYLSFCFSLGTGLVGLLLGLILNRRTE